MIPLPLSITGLKGCQLEQKILTSAPHVRINNSPKLTGMFLFDFVTLLLVGLMQLNSLVEVSMASLLIGNILICSSKMSSSGEVVK